MKKQNQPKPQVIYLVLAERILDGTTLIIGAFSNQHKAYVFAKTNYFRVVSVKVIE